MEFFDSSVNQILNLVKIIGKNKLIEKTGGKKGHLY